MGRPDTFTVLAALAAVTDRLGLTGTINSTFNEPYEVARQFASLDHLSAGRAGWNVVTSWDAFTGENFRRGGFLPQEKRYDRAREFLAATRVLFDSWRGDEVVGPGVEQHPGGRQELPRPVVPLLLRQEPATAEVLARERIQRRDEAVRPARPADRWSSEGELSSYGSLNVELIVRAGPERR